jgi:hypothetical protein
MGQTHFEEIGIKKPKQVARTLVTDVLNGTATLDPASIAAGATGTATITVAGATLGDYAMVSPPYDLGGLEPGYPVVSSVNTVKITLRNNTAAAIDLASGVWKAKVLKG